MNRIFLLVCFCLFSISLFSQKSRNSIDKGLLSSNNIEIVDTTSFFNTVLPRSDKPKVVFIYTNICEGTQGLFDRVIPKLNESLGENVDIILISSAPYRNINSLIRLLQEKKYTANKTYIIDSGKFKDFWKDDRLKGFNFRNAICVPCQKDIIGVPYTIIYDPNGSYVNSGYLTANQCIEILKAMK